MKLLKKLLLTKARVLFWLWYLPGIVWLIWMSATRPELEVAPLFLFVVWVVLGFWAINLSVGLMRRPALRALDEDCDPEPLLELCRAGIRQNPRAVSGRVLEAWALALLGREEESLASANLVEGRWKLRRSAALVLTWCAVLPPDDPRRERTLKRMARGLFVPGKFRPAAAAAGGGRLHPGAGDRSHGPGGVLLPAGTAGPGSGAPGLCGGPWGQAGRPHRGRAPPMPPPAFLKESLAKNVVRSCRFASAPVKKDSAGVTSFVAPAVFLPFLEKWR